MLREEIMRGLMGEGAAERDDLLITNLRHCRCLEAALGRLERAAESLRSGLSEEFAAMDLRAALDELGAITGETSTEDLLNEVFSRFCIGK
jgi:tRNA modification GTPase